MNSNEIFELICQIGHTPGKNDKVALIAANAHDGDFTNVLTQALDPLVSYGVKALPTPDSNGTGVFNPMTNDLIRDLALRNQTGTDALLAIKSELERLTPESAELLKRILTKKLAAGFGDSSVNKAIKGLIREYPYMRCSLPKKMKLDEKSFGWSLGAYSQEKADGMFMNLSVTAKDGVTLSSRQGTQYPMGPFQTLAEFAFANLTAETQTHGEMIVMRNGVVLPREDGNGIINHVEAGGDFGEGEYPVFLAWDQIPLSAVVPKGKCATPYHERLADLYVQLGLGANLVRVIDTRVVFSMAEAWEHYREMLALGKEGTVFKKHAAIWKDGTSTEQGKLKLEAPVELKVTGFNEGTGKFAGALGSLICESACGELVVNVSGRGDAMRAEVWANQSDWLDSIVTVKANLVMVPKVEGDKHSLFLPIFMERRTDKSAADDLAQVKAQFEAAIAAA